MVKQGKDRSDGRNNGYRECPLRQLQAGTVESVSVLGDLQLRPYLDVSEHRIKNHPNKIALPIDIGRVEEARVVYQQIGFRQGCNIRLLLAKNLSKCRPVQFSSDRAQGVLNLSFEVSCPAVVRSEHHA